MKVVNRISEIDRVRGLAVLLMVLDHCLVVYGHGAAASLTRLSVTRLSLPLFCIVAGVLAKDRINGRRLLDVAICGMFATAAGVGLGIGQPDILLVLALGLVLLPVAMNPFGLCLAILQPVTWPYKIDGVPTGYQVGTVLLLLIVGKSLVDRGQLIAVGSGIPRFLETPGKWPLSIYVGHLVALTILKAYAPNLAV